MPDAAVVGSRERRSVAQQQLVVLGATEARVDTELREALESAETHVDLILTDRARQEWVDALIRLEDADTVLAVASADTTTLVVDLTYSLLDPRLRAA